MLMCVVREAQSCLVHLFLIFLAQRAIRALTPPENVAV